MLKRLLLGSREREVGRVGGGASRAEKKKKASFLFAPSDTRPAFCSGGPGVMRVRAAEGAGDAARGRATRRARVRERGLELKNQKSLVEFVKEGVRSAHAKHDKACFEKQGRRCRARACACVKGKAR
jgi:hypothetical protein